MAKRAGEPMGAEDLTVVVDTGCFKGEEILSCPKPDMTASVP